MDWKDLLQILVPIIGFMAWFYHQLDKRIDKMDERIDSRFNKMDEKLQTLDSRVSRIEGQLVGPPRWEPKIHEKKEEK